MVVADDPAALCHVAIDICRMTNADPALPHARGAVGYGLVTAHDGDYFGRLVNIVARATKLARPTTLVVTPEVARHLDPDAWSTERLGPHTLRGVGKSVQLDRAPHRSTRDRSVVRIR